MLQRLLLPRSLLINSQQTWWTFPSSGLLWLLVITQHNHLFFLKLLSSQAPRAWHLSLTSCLHGPTSQKPGFPGPYVPSSCLLTPYTLPAAEVNTCAQTTSSDDLGFIYVKCRSWICSLRPLLTLKSYGFLINESSLDYYILSLVFLFIQVKMTMIDRMPLNSCLLSVIHAQCFPISTLDCSPETL